MPEQWHALTGEEVLAIFQSGVNKGLNEREVGERTLRFGPNRLLKATRIPFWLMFLSQFKDVMVVLLLGATFVSLFLGEFIDALAIITIIALNAILGCVHEYRAERSLEALKQLVSPEARVIRDGLERKIPAEELVPGDIVLLEAGDRIPADLRLLNVVNLETEESALTGESVPVKKEVKPIQGKVALADARNMAYMGTVVTRGRGRGVVVATGMATEMGRIAGMIQEVEKFQTPLQQRLAHLGKILVSLCVLICALVSVLGIYRGEPVYQMFLSGVSLAVAAIPEGLPAIVTVILAIGVQRMARRNAIIRKLAAVETLGCATVICSDKTGTLTQNQMTVRKVVVDKAAWEVTGEGFDPKGEFIGNNLNNPGFKLFLKIAALCSNAVLIRGKTTISGMFRGIIRGEHKERWGINGDPTEGALLVMAAKGGFWREQIERNEQRVAEFPFDSERKRMTVVYRQPSGVLYAYVKGAPDIILELCTHYYSGGKILPLNASKKEEILEYNADMAARALRVLAIAYRELPANLQNIEEKKVERGLIFIGLAGIIDPPRAGVYSAVQKCHRAGIKVVMITGDHRLTAATVAKELGLLKEDRILTGSELDGIDDKQLKKQVKNVYVFARVAPRHKLRIVRALKQNGHVVAMTGDGINDAPAVKESDIGIAMGIAGTDVTKEASAMVLADDNFSTIVAAVEEGRGIYDNIRKTIRYLLSCNVGEILVMFLAVLAGMPLPLLPIQILWMNLVTDSLPAMALGVEPIDREIMSRKPRNPRESIFAHGLGWRIFGAGIVISLGTVFLFSIAYYGSQNNLDTCRTIAFNALVFFQLFYALICRSEHRSVAEVGLLSNPHLLLTIVFSAALQVAVTHVSVLQIVFHTVSLNFWQWGMILAVTLAPFLISVLYHHIQLKAKEKIVYLKV